MRKVNSKPGETFAQHPNLGSVVEDAHLLMSSMLMDKYIRRKPIKIKIGKATFSCLIRKISTTSDEILIGILPSGAPEIKESKPGKIKPSRLADLT